MIVDDSASSWLGNNNGQGQAAEVIKAYLEASAKTGQIQGGGVEYYIDGKIVSEEQYQQQKGQQQLVLSAPRRGFFAWLVGAGKRNHQKLLK